MFITGLKEKDQELLIQKLKDENIYGNLSQREANVPLFTKPVNTVTNVEAIQSAEDEINDFLNNFANFESLFKELKPE